MIKINLLPYRETAKKEEMILQIVFLSGALALFVLVVVVIQLLLSISISGMETKIKEAETKLVALDKKVGDLEGFKKDKREIEQKLGVIKSLEGNRLFPVYMFDEINRLVPEKDIWLEKVADTGLELRIEGVARDNGTVARFMSSLEKVGFIQSVDIVSSKEKDVTGAKLQQFVLSCAIKRGI